MRIGIDARTINKYPGVGRYALNLVKHLAKIDNENEYVIFKNNLCSEKLTDKSNFKEIVVDEPLLSFKTLFSFHKTVMKEKIDFLHCTYHLSPLSNDIKKIVTVHDLMDIVFEGHFSHQPFLIEQGLKYYFKFATPRTILGADELIVMSEYTKMEILKYFPIVKSDKITVIPLGAEEYFKPANEEDKNKLRIKYNLPNEFLLFVGNTKKYKNVDMLIDAYGEYCKNVFGEPFALIIAGMKNVAGDKLNKIIAEMGLENKIKFIGTIDENELPILYSAAKWFIFPSLYEGFGFPPLEAMSCGTPVICSNAASLPEVVGDAGIYFDPRKPEELTKILLDSINDENLRSDLIRKALSQAKKFSCEKTAKETLEVYKNIL